MDFSRLISRLPIKGVTYSGGTSSFADFLIKAGPSGTINSNVVPSTLSITNISGPLTIAGATSVGGNLTVTGNLTVNGTTTTVHSETLTVDDNTIVLNNNYTGSTPTENGGIEVERGTLSNATLLWDETGDRWVAGTTSSVANLTTESTNNTFTGTNAFSGGFSVAGSLGSDLIQKSSNQILIGSNAGVNMLNSSLLQLQANTVNVGVGTAGSLAFTNGGTITTDNATGLKIGTTTINKVGFFGSTPVVQPSGNVLTALSNLGLVGTPSLSATDVNLGNVVNERQVRRDTADTITAVHTFSPATVQPPFIVGACADGVLVNGLNAGSVQGKQPGSSVGSLGVVGTTSNCVAVLDSGGRYPASVLPDASASSPGIVRLATAAEAACLSPCACNVVTPTNNLPFRTCEGLNAILAGPDKTGVSRGANSIDIQVCRSISGGDVACAAGSILIGNCNATSGVCSIGIGTGQRLLGACAIGIGTTAGAACAGGASAIAIGTQASATLGCATAIGLTARATGGGSIANGNGASGCGTNAIAIGTAALACGTNATAIGGNVMARSSNSTAIGGTNSSIVGAEGATWATIVGGNTNCIAVGSPSSVIVGGNTNTISGSCSSSIIGGSGNCVTSGSDCVLVTGSGNVITNTAHALVVGGNHFLQAFGGGASTIGTNNKHVAPQTFGFGCNGFGDQPSSLYLAAGPNGVNSLTHGAAQGEFWTLKAYTTPFSDTAFMTNGSNALPTFTCVQNTFMAFDGIIVGREEIDGVAAGFSCARTAAFRVEGYHYYDTNCNQQTVMSCKGVITRSSVAYDVNLCAGTGDGVFCMQVVGDGVTSMTWAGFLRFARTRFLTC